MGPDHKSIYYGDQVMATNKFITGRSSFVASVDFVNGKSNIQSNRMEMENLTATVVARQRMAICLRAQEG